MKVKSYSELKRKLSNFKGKDRVLADIKMLEKKDSRGMETLGSEKAVRDRLVTWWNEKGTKHDITYQRTSFVLMQELKKKLKRVV